MYHSLIWGVFFVTILAITSITMDQGDDWWTVVKQDVIGFFWLFPPITYLNFYLKDRFFDQRKYVGYLLSIPLQISVGVAAYQLNYRIFDLTTQTLAQDAINVFFVLAFSTGAQYFKRGIASQYQLQELKAQNAQIELNALKAQINPHFLFNTLNNIYATNQIDAVKGSEMIMELSEVMRYHLHFSKLDRVPLEDEIQLAHSYIALEKLRLSENCDVKVTIDSSNNQLLIAPLIFLPFLENAFKHGTVSTQPCFVHLAIRVEDRRLYFEISNSVIAGKKIVQNHIGLQNTRRRLDLIYPQKHKLLIMEEDKVFKVQLTIDF